MQQNGTDATQGVVIRGAFGRPSRPAPVLVGRTSAAVVSLAAYRAARSIGKGHAWLELGH
jgi:hypothetical protein